MLKCQFVFGILTILPFNIYIYIYVCVCIKGSGVSVFSVTIPASSYKISQKLHKIVVWQIESKIFKFVSCPKSMSPPPKYLREHLQYHRRTFTCVWFVNSLSELYKLENYNFLTLACTSFLQGVTYQLQEQFQVS